MRWINVALSLVMALNAIVSMWSERMLGFPDGYRGEAEIRLTPIFGWITWLSIILVAASLGLGIRHRPTPLTRILTVGLLFAGACLCMVNFGVEAVMKARFPATGG